MNTNNLISSIMNMRNLVGPNLGRNIRANIMDQVQLPVSKHKVQIEKWQNSFQALLDKELQPILALQGNSAGIMKNMPLTQTVKVSKAQQVPRDAKPIKQGVTGPYSKTINAAAQAFNLDPALIQNVIKAESNFNPKAVSKKGAQGLMQLMPGTAKALGVKDPFNAEKNIMGGSKYLKTMIGRFGSVEKGLAAYNAGPGTVSRYGGIPPYAETQNYVRKVLKGL